MKLYVSCIFFSLPLPSLMITRNRSQRFLLWVLVVHGGATATGDPSGEKTLSQTPTWAVAVVCTFLILISHLLEKGLQRLANVSFLLLFFLRVFLFCCSNTWWLIHLWLFLSQWLWKKHKNSLIEALEKVKAGN